GGLAGRDLEVVAVGLEEVLEYDYQVYRHATVEYLLRKLDDAGIPVMKPAGGHAVFIDAKVFMDHVPPLQYPGIALVNALYLEGGIRAVELGSVMFGQVGAQGLETPAPLELVRLAFPRRVYTQSHFDYLAEIIYQVWEKRNSYTGYRIVKQPKLLRHFSCWFEEVS
ncbi:MAG: beta-eliminating lyase-related protein, partial [Bacteroidota bacterium]